MITHRCSIARFYCAHFLVGKPLALNGRPGELEAVINDVADHEADVVSDIVNELIDRAITGGLVTGFSHHLLGLFHLYRQVFVMQPYAKYYISMHLIIFEAVIYFVLRIRVTSVLTDSQYFLQLFLFFKVCQMYGIF